MLCYIEFIWYHHAMINLGQANKIFFGARSKEFFKIWIFNLLCLVLTEHIGLSHCSTSCSKIIKASKYTIYQPLCVWKQQKICLSVFRTKYQIIIKQTFWKCFIYSHENMEISMRWDQLKFPSPTHHNNIFLEQ